jgi:prepilin-type N-terminal cleavage/methylation domain-containing protein
MKHRLTSRCGFSLAEVMIAILVIVIGLAGVTASLVYGVRNSTKGKDISDSAQLARTLFEYTQGTTLIDSVDAGESWLNNESGLNDGPTVRRLLNSEPFGGVVFTPQQVERYKRNIKVERLSNEETSHQYQLARVTIKVTWEDSQGEHNSELIGVIRHARP